MIIIVTVKKNTLIVSSELTMLHKHDLISPLNGAGIVNSVFQKEDGEVLLAQRLEQGHTAREGGKLEPGPWPLPSGSQDALHWARLTCLLSLLISPVATAWVPGA